MSVDPTQSHRVNIISCYSRVDQYLVGTCVPITLGKGDPVGSIHASGSVDRHLEPPGKSCPAGLCRGRDFYTPRVNLKAVTETDRYLEPPAG